MPQECVHVIAPLQAPLRAFAREGTRYRFDGDPQDPHDGPRLPYCRLSLCERRQTKGEER
jgi:hypothetical protein